MKKLLTILLLSMAMIANAQTKLSLTTAMLTTESGGGDATLLVDEQASTGDLMAGPGETCTVLWEPASFPATAVIDLGKMYVLSQVFLMDLDENDGMVELLSGSTDDWTILLTDELLGFDSWNQHNVTVTTQFLRVILNDANAVVSEMVIYGTEFIDTEAPAIPVGLTASNTTSISTVLSWSAATDNVAVTAYKIYRNGVEVDEVTGTQGAVGGLTAETTYAFTVSALDAAGNESAQSVILSETTPADIDTQAPTSPANLSVANVTVNAVALAWNASIDNVGVESYNIYVDGVFETNVSGTNFSLTGLAHSSTYSITITALDASGNESSPSNPSSVTTLTPADIEVPSTPTALAYANVTATAANLTWAAATDNVNVTGYMIYVDGVHTGSGTVNSFSLTGLSNTTTYVITVSAVDAAGNESGQSTAVSLTTAVSVDTTAPSIPQNLLSSSLSPTSVNLIWDASTDDTGVMAYRVYKDGTLEAQIINGDTVVSIIALSAGMTYDFTVSAIDTAGNESVPSAVLNITAPDVQAPTTPISLSATDVTSNSALISWAASTDNVAVVSYNIYEFGTLLDNVDSLSFPLLSLDSGSNYFYRISALDAAGNESSLSNELTVTTTTVEDNTAPTAPSNLQASNETTTSVDLVWEASTDNILVTNYHVYVNNVLGGLSSGLTYTLTGLIPGHVYQVYVSACDENENESLASNMVPVTTLPATGAQKILLTDAMVFGDAVSGNEDVLVDQQFLAGDPINNLGSDLSNLEEWNTGLGHEAVIDLGQEYASLSFYAYVKYGNAPEDAIIIYSSMDSSTWIQEFQLNSSDNLWRGQTLSANARYIRLDFQNGGNYMPARIIEVVMYGEVVGSPDTEVPSVPQNVVATNVTANSALISWDPSTDNIGVIAYRVYVDGLAFGVVDMDTVLMVTGLQGGTQFNITVTALDAVSNESGMSAVVQVSTEAADVIAPSVPTNLLTSNVTVNAVNITWDPSDDNIAVVGYRIYIDDVLDRTVTLTSSSVTGLIAATLYEIGVSAVDAAGNESSPITILITTDDDVTPVVGIIPLSTGMFSGDGDFAILFDQQGDVGDPKNSQGGDLAGSLYWNPGNGTQATIDLGELKTDIELYAFCEWGNDPADSYTISSSVNGTDWTEEFTMLTTLTGWRGDAFTLNAQYIKLEFPVIPAWRNSHTSEIVIYGVSSSPDIVAPSVPANLVGIGTGSTTIQLNWDVATDDRGVTGYKVYQGLTEIADVAIASYTVSGLTASTSYDFSVLAYDAAGNESAQTAAISVSTTEVDTQAPSVPQNLSENVIGATSISLTWNLSLDNNAVIGYKIYVDAVENNDVATNTGSAINLTPETEYVITVSAYDAAGNESGESASITVSTVTASNVPDIIEYTGDDANNNASKVIWENGETVQFLNCTANAYYVYEYAKADPIATLTPSAGLIDYTPPGAGVYYLTTVNDFSPSSPASDIHSVIAYDPWNMTPVADSYEPADFDTYWAGLKADLAAIPVNNVSGQSPTSGQYTKFKLEITDGYFCYGYIHIPTGVGPFPAVLWNEPHPGTNIDPAVDGWFQFPGDVITVIISADVSASCDPTTTDCGFSVGIDNPVDPDTYQFKYSTLAGLRAIDWLYTLSEFDGQNFYMAGNSRGGGMSLLIAGADGSQQRVKEIFTIVPAMCEYAAFTVNKASGWPDYVVPTSSPLADGLAATAYFDAVNLAKRYQGDIVMLTGLKDVVCPTYSTLNALNQIQGTKKVVIGIEEGHSFNTVQDKMEMLGNWAATKW